MVKTIKQIIEDNGFEVIPGPNDYDIGKYTPAGEDWHIAVWKLTDLVEYAENFDPDDEMEMWCEAKQHGSEHMRKSIPGYGELWQDQLWKQKILKKMAKQIKRTKQWQNSENA